MDYSLDTVPPLPSPLIYLDNNKINTHRSQGKRYAKIKFMESS